jgi:hypothetical protein
MMDFKGMFVFEVVEKDPDYFLECGMEWDPETGVIHLDVANIYMK